MNVIAKSGVALDDVAFMAHGTTVVINAVTERNGVVTGADHLSRVPRRARDRAGKPAGLLQPALRQAAGVRPAPAAAGAARAS